MSGSGGSGMRRFRGAGGGTRRVAVLAAVAAVGGLASACSSNDGGGDVVRVAPAVHVNRADPDLALHRSYESPAVLVDRSDPDIVYLAGVEMATGGCRFFVSADGGQSWQREAEPELLPFTRNCAMGTATSQNIRTELQQTPSGALYLVFQANAAERNGSRSVMFARSDDRGRSWQTVALDPGTPGPAPGVMMEVNFEGHVAVDPADEDHLFAMWRRSFNNADRSTAPPTRPFMSESTDGGLTWSTPRMVVDENSGFDGPRPVIVGDALWAFYRVSASATQPQTRLFAAVSRDSGATWEPHLIVAAGDASEPIPMYDRERGQFYAVWHDNRENELDAYFSRSADGVTWEQPQLLNDDPRGTRVGQHYPQMSMSPDGRIDVAWYDWRDDPFPVPVAAANATLSLFSNRGVMASVYLTSSRDGGDTWSPNVRVNDVPIDRSIGTWKNNIDVMAPVSLTSRSDSVVVAWSDTRNGNTVSQAQDIYAAQVSFGGDGGSGNDVDPLAAGVAGGLLGLGVAMCLAFLVSRRRAAPA